MRVDGHHPQGLIRGGQLDGHETPRRRRDGGRIPRARCSRCARVGSRRTGIRSYATSPEPHLGGRRRPATAADVSRRSPHGHRLGAVMEEGSGRLCP
ncbi:hypothetical protein FM106_08890 [Brachybacterium faecium]|nr:hypothetical protein FM106_08890 [Brachybacterium faecium]